MLFHRICCRRAVQMCKRCSVFVISAISILIIIQANEYFFAKVNTTSIAGKKIYSSLSIPMIHGNRSKIVIDKCNYTQAFVSNITKGAPATLVKTYPWLNAALFSVQSKSLMYCAIPKVASKTLISLIVYVYVRDVMDYFHKNGTNIDVNRTHPEQLINISKLIELLRKNGITLSSIQEPNSIASFLQNYLHILRFESLNDASPSVYLNPWRLSLDHVFPDIHFKSLTNISQVFSPSFTRALFVRHPFERLASAYKERIATLAKDRIESEPYYDSLRKAICVRLTPLPDLRPLARRNLCDGVIPLFEEFVRYILLSTNTTAGLAQMDGHWKPYTMICQVCQFQYNFIGKYETFDDDLASFLQRLDVSDWNIQKRRGASGHTKWQYQQMFASLPDNLICELKRIYKDDFHFFNYRVEDYVNRTTLTC